MAKLNNRCWICGSIADSGEHIPKASNLRDLFGDVNQQDPLYFNSASHKNKLLQSINSRLLKMRVICASCNNSKTQKSDLAWDEFNRYLNTNARYHGLLSKISFNRVYKYDSRKRALSFHLYAVKLFGCIASELDLNFDLADLSNSILKNKLNQNVYIGVGRRKWCSDIEFSGPSDLCVKKNIDGLVVAAVWFLVIGEWEFQFIYAKPGIKVDGLIDTWNPKSGYKLDLKDFID